MIVIGILPELVADVLSAFTPKILNRLCEAGQVHGNMTALDATGLRAFEELAAALHAAGRHLILCGARHQPSTLIARADFHRRIGDANICPNVTEALKRARDIHARLDGAPTRPAA